jgi:hypothetical protein
MRCLCRMYQRMYVYIDIYYHCTHLCGSAPLLDLNAISIDFLVKAPLLCTDCTPVFRIRIRSNPGLFGRVRIRILRNELILTFLVFVQAINTSGISVVQLFGSWTYFLEHIFIKKIFGKKLAKNLCRSGSGSVSGRFRKSDPDPVKNRPDPQHCCTPLSLYTISEKHPFCYLQMHLLFLLSFTPPPNAHCTSAPLTRMHCHAYCGSGAASYVS